MTVDRKDFEAAVAAYWGARNDQLTASIIAGAIGEPVRALDWQHFTEAIRARITYLAELGFPGR